MVVYKGITKVLYHSSIGYSLYVRDDGLMGGREWLGLFYK